MKLRLRSFETKETLKMEVPNPCNLDHLRELVSQELPSPPHSCTIYFSLNRKDELTTNSPEESIQSIGITSGDLIYYTTNPNGFSTLPSQQSLNPQSPNLNQALNPKSTETLNPKLSEALNPKSTETLNPKSCETLNLKLTETPNPKSTETLNPKLTKTLITNPEKGKTVDFVNPDSEDTAESMEIDDDNSVTETGKSFSVPGFLRKVFTEELGDKDNLNHKLLAISVHAVLLESGFIELNPASNSLNTLHLTSFHYTLPDIITNEESVLTNAIKIKFQNLGKYCKVYGSLVNGTTVHSVLLDEDKLVPFLNVVWANCGQVVETMKENNIVSSILPEKEVFEFWRKVKDELALPLLIDLHEKAGLELPPCFMRLPTELKLKILESVSGVEIAKMSCVCSEMRYLGSSEDLWKQKFVEKFGNAGGMGSFKERFAKVWERRRRRKVGGKLLFNFMRRSPYAPFGPNRFTGMIGGDYDMGPSFGQYRLRNVMPNCNLGGFRS